MTESTLDTLTTDEGNKIQLAKKDRPREFFHDNREAEDARKATSREIHESMTPERQAVLEARLVKGLLWMADNVADWLPISLAWNTEGDSLSVEHFFVISDLADGEDLMALGTSKECEDALAIMTARREAAAKALASDEE